MTTLHLALFILAAPVLAFMLLALAHQRIARHGDFLATAVMGLCLAAAVVIFIRAQSGAEHLLVNVSFDWLPLGLQHNLRGGFMVDSLTAVMLVVVTLVSFLVHLFSIKYMEDDVRYGRYYASLLLFSASMLGLVLANNLLFLFIFWEMVGLSSYLLIGHWYEKKSASDAAIKAFITTRIGDVGMFIGLLICYAQVGSLDYADLFAGVSTGALTGTLRTMAALGIFFGAMGKSAQFPLHVWLPDAMEGPTPVSALIHAATMVAAGVYLVGRMMPLFDEPALLTVAYVGGFTAVFAATIAFVQDDIKKVLAYSTVSQLGLMMLGLGVGGYSAGLFHLTTHAFFKAGLFLGSGAVIHAMHHEQSLRKYGGLWRKMPKTAFCYLLAALALVGFPGFAGFWSKDMIIGDALVFAKLHGHWGLACSGVLATVMTGFYMTRQFCLTFTGKPRDRERYLHAQEVPWQMLAPLIILGILAMVGGGLGHWFEDMNPKLSGIEQVREFARVGPLTPLMDDALRYAPLEEEHEDHKLIHSAHQLATLLATSAALLGIFFGLLFFFERANGKTLLNPAAATQRLRIVHLVLSRKYYFDELYWALFVLPTHALARFCARFDRGVIDGVVNFIAGCGSRAATLTEIVDRIVVDAFLVLGVARTTAAAGEQLSTAQNGYVRRYIEITAAGVVSVIGASFVICILLLYRSF